MKQAVKLRPNNFTEDCNLRKSIQPLIATFEQSLTFRKAISCICLLSLYFAFAAPRPVLAGCYSLPDSFGIVAVHTCNVIAWDEGDQTLSISTEGLGFNSSPTLQFGDGNDNVTYSGGSFDGLIKLGSGYNTGGAFIDTFTMEAGGGSGLKIYGHPGIDQITIGNDTVTAHEDGTWSLTPSGEIARVKLVATYEGNDTISLKGGEVDYIYLGSQGGAESPNSANSFEIWSGTIITAEGATGQDTFTLYGGSIRNVRALDGDDTIVLDGSTVNAMLAGNGNDNIYIKNGSVESVYLAASPNASDGNNTINISGGTITNSIFGGNSNDIIRFSNGEILGSIVTYDGNDTVEISGQNVTIRGDVALGSESYSGNSNDTLLMTEGRVYGTIKGDDGSDIITLNGGIIEANVIAGAGNDQLELGGAAVAGRFDAGDGEDSVSVSAGTIGKDLKGGGGADTINISGGTILGNVIFGENDGSGSDQETFTISSGTIEKSVIGDGGQDFISLHGGLIEGDVLANAGSDNLVVAGATIEKSIYLGSYELTETDVDTFTMSSGTVALGVYGDAGNDQFNVNGGSIGNVGGREGNDIITLEGNARVTQIAGGDDIDTINLISGTVHDVKWGDGDEGQTLDLTNVTVSGTLGFGAGSDHFTLVNGVIGGDVKLGHASDDEGPEEGEIVGYDSDIFRMEGGVVHGSVYGDLYSGDDITIVGGTILGDIITAQGDDTLTWIGGAIAGDLDGGDGEDTLNLGSAQASVSAKRLIGWENINFTGTREPLLLDAFESDGSVIIGTDTSIVTNSFSSTGSLEVAVGKTFTLNITDAGELSGQLIGSGSFVKDGVGRLRLTSESLYTGTIVVRDGSFGIDGSTTADVIVEQTGRLEGSGVLGSTTVSGVLAPGNSPDTMTYAGDLTLNAVSIVEIDVDGRTFLQTGGAGSYDRIVITNVNAVASLDGTLTPILRGITGSANNDFIPVFGDTFTIVTTSNPNGISGVFATVSQPTNGTPDNARFDVLYASNSLDLVLTPDSYEQFSASFSDVANYRNFGRALDIIRPAAGSNPDTSAQDFFEQLYPLNGSQLTAAMVTLTGEVHAFAITDLRDGAHSLSRNSFVGGLNPQSEGRNAWIDVSGTRLTYSQDKIASRYESDLGNIWLGFDLEQRGDLRYGLAFGHGRSELDAGIAGSSDSTLTMLMGYYASRVGDITFGSKFGLGRGTFNTERSTVLADGLHNATASGAATLAFATVSADYHHELQNGFDGRLWADLSVMYTEADSYVESGSSAIATAVQGKTLHSGALTLGYEVTTPMSSNIADYESAATFGFGLRHAFGGDRIYSRALTMHGAEWDVSGVDVDPTTAFASLGVTYVVGNRQTVSAAVIGQGNHDYTGVGASLAFVSRF